MRDDKVIPLEPDAIVPQDRAAKRTDAEKPDCENRAAKRWLACHGKRHAALDAIDRGDDLFSRQPLCQAVRDGGGHFIVQSWKDRLLSLAFAKLPPIPPRQGLPPRRPQVTAMIRQSPTPTEENQNEKALVGFQGGDLWGDGGDRRHLV